MRLLEVLLIVVTFLWATQKVSSLKLNIKNLEKTFLMGGFVLAICHIALEGARWQMALVYITFLFLVVGTFSNIKVKPKIGQWGLFGLGAIAILISAGLSCLLPVFSLPKTQGDFNTVSSHQSTRGGISYKIWSPVEKHLKIAKTNTYLPSSGVDLGGIMGMPSFVFSHLKLVKTHSSSAFHQFAQSQNFPLVIYSHGANSTYLDNTALLEEIASHGYVVVTIDHGFSFEKYGLDVKQAQKIEINAQKSLIDQLIKRVVPKQVAHYQEVIKDLQKRFKSHIDFDQISLMGHSLGGATACSGGLTLPNMKAVINMDGPVDNKITSNYTIPLLYFSSFSPDLSNRQLEAFKVPPKFYRGVKKYELKPVKALFLNNTHQKYWVRFKHSNHLDFTDMPFIIPLMSAPNHDRDKGHALKSKIVISFLDRELKKINKPIRHNDSSLKWLYPMN